VLLEWRKTCAHGTGARQLQQIQAVIDAENARKPGERTWSSLPAISHIVSRSSEFRVRVPSWFAHQPRVEFSARKPAVEDAKAADKGEIKPYGNDPTIRIHRSMQKARALTRTFTMMTSQGEFARDFAPARPDRRAGVSSMSNIAEGFEREGNKEFIQFLTQSKGSDWRDQNRNSTCAGRPPSLAKKTSTKPIIC